MAKQTRKEKEQASRSATPTSAPNSGFLSVYRPLIDRLVFGLSVFGILVTVHLWIQQGRGFDQGCWGFNPPQGGEQLFNCQAVVTSGAGSIMGISNVYWGMIFYVAVAILSFLLMRAKPEGVGTLKRIRAGLIGFGFIYSMYLVNYQINSIGELCALCLTSAAIATVLFGTTIYDLITGDKSGAGRVSAGVMKAESRFYSGAIGVLALLLVGDFIYFNNLPAPPPPPPAEPAIVEAPVFTEPPACLYDPRMATYDNYLNLISDNDPMLGNPASDVVVIEYFDPNCPHCQDLHPLMKQMVATHSAVSYTHLTLPTNREV